MAGTFRSWLDDARYRLTTRLLRSRHRLLDPDWYRTRNGLRSIWFRLPLLHYLLFGRRAGLHHHPLFSPEYFAMQCHQHGLPVPQRPLHTYLRDRCYWRVNPHPLFDTAFYCRHSGEELVEAPLLHYLNGGHLQYDPHPLFRRCWYLTSYQKLESLRHHCALVHYVKEGWRGLVSTHPLFDAVTYVAGAGLPLDSGRPQTDPLRHFLQSGSATVSCHPLFEPEYFCEQAGVACSQSVATLLVDQYLLQSAQWRTSTHPLFDAPYYLTQQANANPACAPLQQYIEDTSAICNPHPLFDTGWYLGRKKDLLLLKGQNRVPLFHFVTVGYRVGESPHPLFALQWYRHTYLQGKVNDTNPLLEFLAVGEQQGNRPNPLYPPGWRQVLVNRYGCNSLRDFAVTHPCVLPVPRNRINDVFATGYLAPAPAVQWATPDSRNYFILFTPRSGSSWLTELLVAEKTLGQPGEWFNPDLMLSAMSSLPQQCHTIQDYCAALQLYRQSPQGVFGAELTALHLGLLQELVNVVDIFRQPAYVVHLRRNLVAQAVSLLLATESGFFHAGQTANRGAVVPFNAVKISKWLDKLVREEQLIHAFLQQQKSACLLSWYEDLCDDPRRTIRQIATYLGMPLSTQPAHAASQHSKIGGTVNREYERRFREECPGIVAAAEAARPFMALDSFGTPSLP